MHPSNSAVPTDTAPNKGIIYNLGADIGGKTITAIKPIAWPFNVWTCYIPDNVNPELNILEKLILSLVHKGLAATSADITNILVKQINLNADLVKNVLDTCMKKHFNQTYTKTLKLKTDSQRLLESLTGEISPDMEMSNITKKIYLFHDAASNTIVPIFNIDTFPSVRTTAADPISLPRKSQSRLKTAAINNALRRWGRLFKTMQSGETAASSHLDLTAAVNSDTNKEPAVAADTEPIKTLENKESKQTISAITVFDDEPQKIDAIGYLVFDAANPTELEVISPFGSVYNNWFLRQINHLRIADPTVENALQTFLKECQEQYKDLIALNNPETPPLFIDCPNLTNDETIRKSITLLHKDIVRYRSGENETDNFCKNMRVAIEGILTLAVDSSDDLIETKRKYRAKKKCSTDAWQNAYNKYNSALIRAINAFQCDKTLEALASEDVFSNMANRRTNHPKNSLAILLLHAYDNQSSIISSFVRDYAYIFATAYNLINLGNDASHPGSKNYTNIFIRKETAENYYGEYATLVRLIYTQLLAGNAPTESTVS